MYPGRALKNAVPLDLFTLFNSFLKLPNPFLQFLVCWFIFWKNYFRCNNPILICIINAVILIFITH